ncbi:FMN-binding protein [Aestuariimicrobium kwangyangense]|uniref:FMN-binding protein n=1 Tax=Aestuariimicrobium kwangyangense TaxID=396389 RepID=UPI0003B71F3B|nr:FMN-binding protein [Aestuariimicrobium kwangyangense]
MSTRSTIAAVTAGAGVLALGWNIGTVNSQTLGASQPSTTQSTTQSTTTQSGSTGSGATGAGQTGRSGSTGQSGDQSTTSQAAPSSSAPSASGQASTPSSGLKDGTYTGQTINHQYGSVTVTVTVSGGRISGLSEQVSSDGDHHSIRIDEQAVPMLRSEVLAANSAAVNTISGGTYTSEAYLQSLQSALDQAK